MFSLRFMLFPTFKKKIGVKNVFRGGGGGILYQIYIKKIVVLASEPVGGRSRATELPCLILVPGGWKNVLIIYMRIKAMGHLLQRHVCM